ncbi:MAG: hypothetical protein WBO10_05635 [Pyrinomonadaceae bacterium]
MKSFWVLASAFSLACSLGLTVSAQEKGKAKPLATPPPVLSTAEIISRASDYNVRPVETKTPDKIDEKEGSASSATVDELTARIAKLEAGRTLSYDEKQKRLLLNLDILTRAEQRSESLRKQLFEMIEKENSVRSRMQQIEFDSRPEMIERSLQMAGSMKPEEIRDSRRKSLLAEKTNLAVLLTEIESTRANLASSLSRSDQIVEKLRTKLEKDIDDSFLKEPEPDFRDPV